jgi:ketosteroid isomerase-like protein
VNEEGFRTWLDAYEQAYEARDPDAAAKLFSEDATYQWGPFGELLRGPEEIRERWARAVGDAREKDFQFDYEVLGITDALGFARWTASADVPDKGRRFLFDGVFAVGLRGELCHEFREWWNTREEPLE